MSRFPLQIAAAMLGLAAFAAPALAAPALAADDSDSSDKVDLVIVYGKDACPASRADEIIVCARKPESERYRIPEGLRDHPSPDNQAWTNRVTSYERVGAAGTQSCSATGAGGWTGCFHNFISQAYAEKKAGQDTHFSEMVAAARAQREATIDARAAEQQAQVEAAEKAQAASQPATANPAPDSGK
ncbi:MAG: hypothetical protein KGK11_02780 [Sphingomonadales bacterium]|nr:hypothetical protein [Sphingomonadales bacterium]